MNEQQRKWILPLGILSVAGGLAWLMVVLQSTPEFNRESKNQPLSIETLHLQPVDFPIFIESYGVTRPKTESSLTAQVSGKVVSLSDKLRDGAFFNANEVLLRIDPRDYQIEVEVAQADVASAESLLLQEQAQAEIALKDWQTAGRKGQPPVLAVRKPQLDAAAAHLKAAKARLQKAELNLQRTTIYAPYEGRVLSKQVDIGQVLSANTAIARIYATDALEVRLPVKSHELPFLALPTSFSVELTQPAVNFWIDIGKERVSWQGKIVRVESSLDADSRQTYLIAQIDQPVHSVHAYKNLSIGQFLNASISGLTLRDVYVLPRDSLTQNFSVSLMFEGTLERRKLEPIWTNHKVVVVKEGVSLGDKLVLTPINNVPAGTAIREMGTDHNDKEKWAKKKQGQHNLPKSKNSRESSGSAFNNGRSQ